MKKDINLKTMKKPTDFIPEETELIKQTTGAC